MAETSAAAQVSSPAGGVGSPPPAPDYDDIVAVIQLYIDGFNNSDIDSFHRCFQENAWWACTTADGTFDQHPVAESLPTWTTPEYRGCTHQILSVTQAGDVASVLLEMHDIEDPSSAWVDIHALLRIDGVWKDMNKTATHADRAAWAGTLVPR